MAEYVVTGRRPYREHKPGERFEATLDAETEARAIRRGSIRVLDNSAAALTPDSWRFPRGPSQGSKRDG